MKTQELDEITIDNIPHYNEILSEKFLRKYKNKNPKWGFGGLGYIVFKRTYARPVDPDERFILSPEQIEDYKKNSKPIDTEEWSETIARCIRGGQKIGAQWTQEEAERLFDHIFNLRCCFSGRGLWQLGTSTVDKIGMDSLLNCWVTKASDIEDFAFIFIESMLGGGVGCVTTKEYIFELPRVKRGVKCFLKDTNDADFIVPDSKEGWKALWLKILEAYLVTGKGFTYSTICIRHQGEPIKTFGGIAPGPKPLKDGAAELCKILESREGKKLRTQDVTDVICIGGEVVKSGGVRRTALILQGDVDDTAFINLKRWDLGQIPAYRSNSNNSVMTQKFEFLSQKFWDHYNGEGEKVGLINLKNCRRFGRLNETEFDGFELHDDSIIGVNPSMPSGTLVGTKSGIFQIQELEDKEFYVKSLDKKWAKAKCFLSGRNKDVYKINFGYLRDTYATKEHKWPVLRSGKITKVNTTDLIAGDMIPLNINEDTGIVGDAELTQDEGFLVGMLLGDGWISKKENGRLSAGLTFNKSDRYLAEKVLKIINNMKKNPSSITERSNELNIQFTEEEFCNKLVNKYGLYTSSSLKDIPSSVWKSNDEYIKGFIDGLLSSDGHIGDCNKKSKYVTFSTSRQNLAINLAKLLSFYGLKATIKSRELSEASFPNKKDYDKTYIQYEVKLDSHAAKKFCNIFYCSHVEKQKRLENIKKLSLRNIKSKDYITVKSVVKHSSQDVWDITVYHDQHVFPHQFCYTGNCAEATLADKECCNLSEIAINNISSKEEMLDCAILLYKAQKAICAGKYMHDATNKIVHKNMRIGLSVTGVCQQLGNVESWCDYTYKNLRKFDKQYSKENGWPQSIRLTVIQPSGTKSLLFGSMPGGHPGYSEFIMRTVRFSYNDPLISKLKECGYRMEPEIRLDGSLNHDIVVVYFPCKFEQKGLYAEECGAIKQLEIVKSLQTHWADQAVSVTIYYKEEELEDIKKWLQENYNDNIKTVSFLQHSDHGFKQAPYTKITEEEYNKEVKDIRTITDFIDDSGDTNVVFENCEGGACPIK